MSLDMHKQKLPILDGSTANGTGCRVFTLISVENPHVQLHVPLQTNFATQCARQSQGGSVGMLCVSVLLMAVFTVRYVSTVRACPGLG